MEGRRFAYRRKRRAKRWALLSVPVAVAASALVGGQLVAAKPVSHACGGHERWKIKTLTDDDVGRVNFDHVVNTTVDRLRALRSRPEKVSSKSVRIRPVERTVYRVRAVMHEAKLEPDDDIHLVIHDDDLEDTMIVEFPDSRCDAARDSIKSTKMAEAREDFIAHVTACLGRTPSFRSFTTLGGEATIVGVGFWDVKHGTAQRGRAPQESGPQWSWRVDDLVVLLRKIEVESPDAPTERLGARARRSPTSSTSSEM